ncbi:MAG: 50S ribosomal protein L9 [Actinobacteria bacterium HGW-Actinobacteria-4]|nr:MAG: 50S ribosomal protein L9 [Actinobacteria bacterium HGW-Actinobacteria-4]
MAKVILTHEVNGLGTAGDVVDVKDGYARNYLMPRGLASQWSAGAEKQIEALRKSRREREIASVEEAQAARDVLQSNPVVVAVKAGATGRLFGAVTPGDVADAIGDRAKVDKRRIQMPQHIKTIGDYQVTIALQEGVSATVELQVVAQK